MAAGNRGRGPSVLLICWTAFLAAAAAGGRAQGAVCNEDARSLRAARIAAIERFVGVSVWLGYVSGCGDGVAPRSAGALVSARVCSAVQHVKCTKRRGCFARRAGAPPRWSDGGAPRNGFQASAHWAHAAFGCAGRGADFSLAWIGPRAWPGPDAAGTMPTRRMSGRGT